MSERDSVASLAEIPPSPQMRGAADTPPLSIFQKRLRKFRSIKVGKTADLALVQGDPSARIADLRQTRMVMLDGKVLDADALRNAAGYSGRPK